MPALTRDQARQIDRIAIEMGIPGVVLMENAAINAAGAILDLLDRGAPVPPRNARVHVLCGGGNNGGDGYAIARHLFGWGCCVTLFAAADPVTLKGDAATNHTICRNLGLEIHPVHQERDVPQHAATWRSADLIVDALLGTGFTGLVRPHYARIIEAVNALDGPPVVSVDVPSGLDCDTGKPGGAAIRASVTVTFVDTKVGYAAAQARPYLGRVVVADIGVPPQIIHRILHADAT